MTKKDDSEKRKDAVARSLRTNESKRRRDCKNLRRSAFKKKNKKRKRNWRNSPERRKTCSKGSRGKCLRLLLRSSLRLRVISNLPTKFTLKSSFRLA